MPGLIASVALRTTVRFTLWISGVCLSFFCIAPEILILRQETMSSRKIWNLCLQTFQWMTVEPGACHSNAISLSSPIKVCPFYLSSSYFPSASPTPSSCYCFSCVLYCFINLYCSLSYRKEVASWLRMVKVIDEHTGLEKRQREGMGVHTGSNERRITADFVHHVQTGAVSNERNDILICLINSLSYPHHRYNIETSKHKLFYTSPSH